MVHDELRVELGDEGEFALAEAWDVGVGHLGPGIARFDHDEADVLRAFFHLAGEVEGSGDDEVWVGTPDWNFEVVAFEVDLGRGEGLLADGEAFAEFDDF